MDKYGMHITQQYFNSNRHDPGRWNHHGVRFRRVGNGDDPTATVDGQPGCHGNVEQDGVRSTTTTRKAQVVAQTRSRVVATGTSVGDADDFQGSQEFDERDRPSKRNVHDGCRTQDGAT